MQPLAGQAHFRAKRLGNVLAACCFCFLVVVFVTALELCPPARAADHLDLVPEDNTETQLDFEVSDQIVFTYLVDIWALLRTGRNAEAYQLAAAAIVANPDVAELELAAGYAAVSVGRCNWARRHIDRIDRITDDPAFLKRRDLLNDRCKSPWRRSLTLTAIFGYRPSIMNLSRQRIVYAEPGSRLHQQCTALVGLCHPGTPFIMPGQRDSAVDMWFQTALTNSWRPVGPWRADVTSIVFLRHPSRSKLTGSGFIIRGNATYEMSSRWAIDMMLESGSSRFQRGESIVPIRQQHQLVEVGISGHPAPRHLPGVLVRLSGGALHMPTSSYVIDEKTRQLQLLAHISDKLSIAGFVKHQNQRIKTPGHPAGSNIRLYGLAVNRTLSSNLAIRVGIEEESEQLRHRRYYLATPHRIRTRRQTADVILQLFGLDNVKVVLNLTNEKVSSRDPLDAPSQKTATLYVKWRIGLK